MLRRIWPRITDTESARLPVREAVKWSTIWAVVSAQKRASDTQEPTAASRSEESSTNSPTDPHRTGEYGVALYSAIWLVLTI